MDFNAMSNTKLKDLIIKTISDSFGDPSDYTKGRYKLQELVDLTGFGQSLDLTVMGGEVISKGDKDRGFVASGYTVEEFQKMLDRYSWIKLKNHSYSVVLKYTVFGWVVSDVHKVAFKHPNTLVIEPRIMRHKLNPWSNEENNHE